MKIAKCPICGREGTVRESHYDGTVVYIVQCQKMTDGVSHTLSGKETADRDMAIRLWNEMCDEVVDRDG